MKVEVRIREDKERGLFATEYIKKGEFVCILPIDYFEYNEIWYINNYDYLNTAIDFRYAILCKANTSLLKNNNYCNYFFHYFSNYFSNNDTTNDTTKINIIGVSNPNVVTGNFIGHMINDYIDMSFINESNYERLSHEKSNVKVDIQINLFEFEGVKRLGLKIIATKNIEKDEELYLSYGSKYWEKYSNNNKFIYPVETTFVKLT